MIGAFGKRQVENAVQVSRSDRADPFYDVLSAVERIKGRKFIVCSL